MHACQGPPPPPLRGVQGRNLDVPYVVLIPITRLMCHYNPSAGSQHWRPRIQPYLTARRGPCLSRQGLTVLDSMEIALFASAGLLNSTIPQPLDVPSSCCKIRHVYVMGSPALQAPYCDRFYK